MEIVPDMPYECLDARGKELAESLRTTRHCPERMLQIQTELQNIAFELWCQYEEGKVKLVEL